MRLMTGRPLGHAPFTVRDAAGHVVLRGRLGPDRGRWNPRWPHVYLVELGRLSRPGAYTLVVWQEAAGEKSIPVTVAAGKTVTQDIQLAAK